jgi:hypothetical protein
MESLKNKLNSFEKTYVALEHAIDTQMRLAKQASTDPYLMVHPMCRTIL